MTFDKLKLITNIDFITDINLEDFTQIVKDERLTSLEYSITSPFSLYIEIDYEEDELVIEFTGKILGHNYPQLISRETIRECFENLNALNICKLDIDAILANSTVVKCDVTIDIDCPNPSGLTAFVNASIRNHKKYTSRQLSNGNLTIEKNVTTNNYKKRITIYSKEKEMNRMDNKRYMEYYDYRGDEFKDKVRFEMNLNSKKQIRNALNIEDTDLMSVLNATTNPIADFIDDILVDNITWTPSSKKEYEAELVLRANNYDIEAVEATLRQVCGKKFHPARDLAPYRELLAREHAPSEFTKEKLLQQLRSVSK